MLSQGPSTKLVHAGPRQNQINKLRCLVLDLLFECDLEINS